MKAFHNDKKIKSNLLRQLLAHYKADEIIKGRYWENGKGCAVGCTIHGSDHQRYETELGIPKVLAGLEDKIFEGLPNREAKKFPLQFIKAIKVGVDLSNVYKDFLVYILVDENDGVVKYAKSEQSELAINQVAEIFSQSITDIKEVIKRRAAVAHAAATYADDDDYYAATAAYYAVNAAYSATTAAAIHAAAAAAYYAASAAARQTHYSKMAKKLLQLLKECV